MRELKFKAWNKEKMVKFDLEDLMYETHNLGTVDLKYWTVMQYTGLKDKNGVEIYEVDIVEFYPWNSPKKALEDYLCKNVKKVIWGLDYGQYPSAGWSVINLQPADLEDGHQLNHMDSRNMEVVGNIFENTEPLKA